MCILLWSVKERFSLWSLIRLIMKFYSSSVEFTFFIGIFIFYCYMHKYSWRTSNDLLNQKLVLLWDAEILHIFKESNEENFYFHYLQNFALFSDKNKVRRHFSTINELYSCVNDSILSTILKLPRKGVRNKYTYTTYHPNFYFI